MHLKRAPGLKKQGVRAHRLAGITLEVMMPAGMPGQTWMPWTPSTPSRAPSSTKRLPPVPPSSAGWNSSTTVPGSSASRAFSSLAAAEALCNVSYPTTQACMLWIICFPPRGAYTWALYHAPPCSACWNSSTIAPGSSPLSAQKWTMHLYRLNGGAIAACRPRVMYGVP